MRAKLPYFGNLAIMPMDLSYPAEESKLPYLHRQSHPRTLRSIASHSMGSKMVMDAQASAREAPHLSKGGPNMPLNLGGFC